MKRKDWRTKKLKKDTFGKKKAKSKYMQKNIYFLRKLYLKKNRNLIKKNLAMNFFFYKKLKNSFFSKFNDYVNKILYKSLSSKIEVLPVFFFSKKIFSNYNNFNFFLKSNNLNYLFIKNYNYSLIQNNTKVYIFNKNLNTNLIDVSKSLSNIKDNFIALPKKSEKEILNNCFGFEEFSYYFNYNVYLNNCIELYKITIILYINKLNNINK